jgi:hypothetical protein
VEPYGPVWGILLSAGHAHRLPDGGGRGATVAVTAANRMSTTPDVSQAEHIPRPPSALGAAWGFR